MTLNPKLDNTCVLCLPFEEPDGSIAYDISNYGNHGTIYGATRVLGRLRKALSFDGVDDRVVVLLTDSLRLTGLTIMAWVKSAVASQRFLFPDAYVAHTNGFFLGQGWPWASGTDWHFRSAGPDGWGPELNLGTVSVDEWTHLAASIEGKSAKGYVNGKLKTEVTLNSEMAPPTHNYFFGCTLYNVYGKGIIDEVRICNRALSAKEIYTHYIYGIQRLRQPRFPEFRKEIRRKLWPAIVV
jgi:hypothetical protein